MNFIIYACIALSLYVIFSAYDSQRNKLHAGSICMGLLLLGLSSACGIGVHPEIFGSSLIPLGVLLLVGGLILVCLGFNLLKNTSPFSQNFAQWCVFGCFKADDFLQIMLAGLLMMFIGGFLLSTELSERCSASIESASAEPALAQSPAAAAKVKSTGHKAPARAAHSHKAKKARTN